MEQQGYGYITGVLATTFEGSKPYKSTCCATYVSWVLQKCGYIKDSEHFDNCGDEQVLLKAKGWKEIEGKDSNLKPGDIIIYFNGSERLHTDIYVGDGKKLNAGGNWSIRSTHYDTFTGLASGRYTHYRIYRPK